VVDVFGEGFEDGDLGLWRRSGGGDDDGGGDVVVVEKLLGEFQ